MGVSGLLKSRKSYLWLIGLWPDEYRDSPIYSQLKVYFVLYLHLLLCALQVMGMLTFATLDTMPEFIVDLFSYMSCVGKLAPLIIYKKQAMELIAETVTLEQLSKVGNVKQLKVSEFWQTCRDKIMKYHLRIYILYIIVYSITPLLSSEKTLPLKLIFSPESLISPWYEILYAAQFFSLVILIANVLGCELYYVIFICKLCEELQLIEVLLTDSVEGCCYETLQTLIKKHMKILKYGEEACQVMAGAFFSQHTFVTVIFCFTAFSLLTTESSATVIKMIMILSMTIAFQCMICSAGELVTTRSEALVDAIVQSDLCSTGYDELHPQQLRQIVFVLLRAQRPLTVSLGTFGVMNLQLFTQTMKGAYSFFMLLRTAYL